MYGHRIEDMLLAMQMFLKAHPKEIVILDFNHFYDMTDAIHKRFAKSIVSIFEEMLFPPPAKEANITMNDMRQLKKQVIVVYHNHSICQTYTEFWSGQTIFSPWPNTSSVTQLIDSLHRRFASLKPNAFNVFQAILTPQMSTVVAHVGSSLKNCLAKKCNKAVAEWLIEVYASKLRGVNIVICDVISFGGCVNDVVKLNTLLVKEK